MSKRFTATEKWNDPWFSDLPTIDKLFWIYLLDNCDHAGIWQVNKRLVKFHLGEQFEINETFFKSRIVKLSDEKWFIPKFVNYQYGNLNPENRAHLSVINILKKEGAYKGLNSSLDDAKDKDKDMDMDMDMDKEKSTMGTGNGRGGKKKPTKNKEPKEKYGSQGNVLLTKEEFTKITEQNLTEKIEDLSLYLGQTGKHYPSHYMTILAWDRKDKKKNQAERIDNFYKPLTLPGEDDIPI